jgi:hypothetical protein
MNLDLDLDLDLTVSELRIDSALLLEAHAEDWLRTGLSPLEWIAYVVRLRGRAETPLTFAVDTHYSRLALIAACAERSRQERAA